MSGEGAQLRVRAAARVLRGVKGFMLSRHGVVRGGVLCRRGHVLVVLLWGGSPWCWRLCRCAVSGIRGCEWSWSLIFTCLPIFCLLDGGTHETTC